jgi:hypothetical protein
MVLDIESKLNEKMLAKMTGAQVVHHAEEFPGTVAERTGRDVMTYVSPGFMPELGNKAPAHGKDVWVPAFSFSHGKPPTPRGFSKDYLRAHQSSEHGTFPDVDVRRPRCVARRCQEPSLLDRGEPERGRRGATSPSRFSP